MDKDQNENDRRWIPGEESLKEILCVSTFCAAKIVEPYLLPDDDEKGIRIPFDGRIRRIPAGAPEIVKSAASLLIANQNLDKALENRDIEGAIVAAFMAGYISRETWTGLDFGKSSWEVMSTYEKDWNHRSKIGILKREQDYNEVKAYHASLVANGLSINKAYQQTADQFGYSKRTVIRIIKD